MSAADAIALKLGVDPDTVRQILEQAQTDPSAPTDIIGYARCLNAGCEEYDTDRAVPMVREFTQERASDLPGVIVSASEHFHPADDKDIHCPSCGEACALLPEKRRTIPKLV